MKRRITSYVFDFDGNLADTYDLRLESREVVLSSMERQFQMERLPQCLASGLSNREIVTALAVDQVPDETISAMNVAPSESVFVGDTPCDKASAISAGVEFIGVRRSPFAATLLHPGVEVVNSARAAVKWPQVEGGTIPVSRL